MEKEIEILKIFEDRQAQPAFIFVLDKDNSVKIIAKTNHFKVIKSTEDRDQNKLVKKIKQEESSEEVVGFYFKKSKILRIIDSDRFQVMVLDRGNSGIQIEFEEKDYEDFGFTDQSF